MNELRKIEAPEGQWVYLDGIPVGAIVYLGKQDNRAVTYGEIPSEEGKGYENQLEGTL